MGDDTVPVSDLGIGVDEVEKLLSEAAQYVETEHEHVVVETEVDTTILAGAANLTVTFHETAVRPDPNMTQRLMEMGLVLLDAAVEDGHLTYVYTTKGVADVIHERDFDGGSE